MSSTHRSTYIISGGLLVAAAMPALHLAPPNLPTQGPGRTVLIIMIFAVFVAGWILVAVALTTEPFENAWDSGVSQAQLWLGPVGSAMIVLAVILARFVNSKAARVAALVMFMLGWITVTISQIFVMPGLCDESLTDSGSSTLCTIAGAITVIIGSMMLSMTDDRISLGDPHDGRFFVNRENSHFVSLNNTTLRTAAVVVFVCGWLGFISQGLRWKAHDQLSETESKAM